MLNLSADASPADVKAAFYAAAKSARPDMAGGDSERFRQVIAAYRLLERAGARMSTGSDRAARLEPELAISIDEAFSGVARGWKHKGRMLLVSLPAGLRPGERVQIDDRGGAVAARVCILPDRHRAVVGDDLWLTIAVDPVLLQDGGRLEVETPYGRRNVWAPRGLSGEALLRVKDCGLPARGEAAQGHAFLKLIPDAALSGSRAREMLDRFAAAWTVAPPPRRAVGVG